MPLASFHQEGVDVPRLRLAAVSLVESDLEGLTERGLDEFVERMALDEEVDRLRLVVLDLDGATRLAAECSAHFVGELGSHTISGMW
jgi:hypothetical protein